MQFLEKRPECTYPVLALYPRKVLNLSSGAAPAMGLRGSSPPPVFAQAPQIFV